MKSTTKHLEPELELGEIVISKEILGMFSLSDILKAITYHKKGEIVRSFLVSWLICRVTTGTKQWTHLNKCGMAMVIVTDTARGVTVLFSSRQ